jgi:ferric-dicitrate binding protein FerR (iron transport regulator)
MDFRRPIVRTAHREGDPKTSSHFSWFLAFLVSMALAFAPVLSAQEQSAGQISREIPTVNIQHGSKVQPASDGAKLLWGDLVTTDRGGRARIALDDGSILNVGSDSQLRVVQHDAANQRTQIQLAYGRLRVSAVRLARAGSNFEVRTPTAVAGVVGTDFALEAASNATSIQVYEGSVTFCNLAGQCVTVASGYSSSVQGNQAPAQPSPTLVPISTQTGPSAFGPGGTDGATAAAPVVAAGVVGSAGPSQGALVRGASLQQGTNIFNGDIVEVGAGGEGVITFGHNAIGRFAELTSVRATRESNRVGLELLRGRMVFRTTPQQPVVGTFADALVQPENGPEGGVAIVAYRNPTLVVVTAERGALAVTAGHERRTVTVPQGQSVEVSLSDAPANAGNTAPPQTPDNPNSNKKKGAGFWWTTGVVLGGGAALATGLALSASQPGFTSTSVCTPTGGTPVSVSTFPCP